MERSAIKNLGYFAEKNPPVTLVIICLLFFTISTCTLAYYTQHQSQLLDTDVLLDIYQLKKFMNDLRVCIKPTGSNSINDQLVKREIDEQVVISASVSMKNLDQLSSNVSLVQGLINLEDFHWSCPDSISPKYLEISFNTSDKLEDDNICVKLRGPRKLLKIFSQRNVKLPLSISWQLQH
ncbi:hypothetical protein WA026_005291 [Henosepilachna vigintioctopunctata]|uniref:TMEM248/TMEM219 domain-containing protein n=1 Tax=Henosepilachna vigintioctopunctata TaxID=420089 RepID=A0AAW1UWZ7_9CUCU